MKTVLSPKENRWATVQVYERARVCVCMPIQTRLLAGLPLWKHMCMDVLDLVDCFILPSPAIRKYLFLYLFFFACVCLCLCTLLGDFGVWSTQRMNKWRALAVGTEVFAKSEDPSSLWTHPAVPLSLSLSAETKTLAGQATLTRNTSARAPRDGHRVEGRQMMGAIENIERRGSAFVLRVEHPSWEMNPLRVLRLLISSIIARWQFFKMYLFTQAVYI